MKKTIETDLLVVGGGAAGLCAAAEAAGAGAKVTVIEILFRYLRDKLLQQRLIFRQDRAEQAALAVLQLHLLFKLMRVGTYSQSAFVIACEGGNVQRDIQRGKFTG